MQKITIYIMNHYRRMNMRLDTLYRNIRFIYKAVAEEIDNIVTLYGHRKRPVSVKIPVSIYSKLPEKSNKG